MKTILFATDFSEASENASMIAMQMAVQLNARLVLFHAYQPWLFKTDFPVKGNLNPELQRLEAMRNLARLRRKLAKSSNTKVMAEVVAREGLTLDVLQEMVNDYKPDVLVMSTAGDAPQAARLFGSLTTAMIARTTVPMLLVPPTISTLHIRQLTLALDLTKTVDAVALDSVARFALAFEAAVDMVCITGNPDDPALRKAAEHIRELFRFVPHTMSLIQGEQLTENLQRFIDEHKTDMLVMLPQAHGWFEQLFTESNTQRMARQSDIPVLAVV
ncbi:universal stress protein [Arsenicibacter rosenii]|uniref:UspA domain-containing protein n=1 Tax=Arsenicibacter rosenii TaxID=1750698 RepID=A0A1S2VQM8_9BACT|nr:universal stress protein [Arsenicibacter rosenii]OIN61071.1 hypothetical protein BLX24_03100 [Arsenicibacter rosenii]